MTQVIETCSCGSTHTRWEDASGLSSNRKYLRCMRCGETLRQRHTFPWPFMLLAFVAALWGWIVVGGLAAK